jgi:hypothetical protein
MRLRAGDVIGIKIESKLALGLISHIHREYGPLVRVFSGEFVSGTDINDFVNKQPLAFSSFVLVQKGIAEGLIVMLGKATVPSHLADFPVFRSGTPSKDGKVRIWFFWDGTKDWEVGTLSAEQRKMPLIDIIDATALAYYITVGWRPETDFRC